MFILYSSTSASTQTIQVPFREHPIKSTEFILIIYQEVGHSC